MTRLVSSFIGKILITFSKHIFYLVAPIEVGCSSDDECAFTQACRNRACMNPCANDNPCGSNAECTVNSHRAVCKCPPGFTGDPYSRCVPSKIIQNKICKAKYISHLIYYSSKMRVSA